MSEVGRMIRENMRKVDFAARYGGDEYLIVLTEIDQAGAEVFAERLRSRIEEHTFTADHHTIRLTASIGYALISPSQVHIDARSFVRLADQALYKAKESGRNRVVYMESPHLPTALPEEKKRRGT